jgi:putative peptidoglycan lipid II flippase
MLMLNRSFFSLQDNWVPTAVALGNLFLNAILDVAFAPFGIWGIPLATSFVNIAGTAALLVVMRRRLGRIDFGSIASSFVRVLLAAAVAGGVAYGVWKPLDSLFGDSLGGQLLALLPAITASVVAYLGIARVLQVREMHALLSLRSRIRSG